MTYYTATLPPEIRRQFNAIALQLTGKTIDKLKCIRTDREWNWPYHQLPRGCACQFDAPDVGMSVLLTAVNSWDGSDEAWCPTLYLRPIGYEHAPWRYGSGAVDISRPEFLGECIHRATELYQKPEYRASWLEHTTCKK